MLCLAGASSQFGEAFMEQCEEPLLGLARSHEPPTSTAAGWISVDLAEPPPLADVDRLVYAAPLEHLIATLEVINPRTVVVLSSTSRFAKLDSPRVEEQELAEQLALVEDELRDWVEQRKRSVTVLRPTLLWGRARDGTVSRLARWVEKFHRLPRPGDGLRQPLHVDDLAAMTIKTLDSAQSGFHAFDAPGEEALPFHEMTDRIFAALGREPRYIKLPRAHPFLRRRFPLVNAFERSWEDLRFDGKAAKKLTGVTPRPFSPERAELLGRVFY